MNLPRYISHKVVQAVKIGSIVVKTAADPLDPAAVVPCGATIFPEGADCGPIEVDPGFVAKHNPEAGGYFVIYEDGYQSFSPADPFERGYTRADGPRCIDPGLRYRLGGAQVLQFMKKARYGDDFVTVAEGTTNEDLLCVLVDRLRTINTTNPCRENSLAITKLEEALHWLDARTRDRQARGVEGTPAV